MSEPTVRVLAASVTKKISVPTRGYLWKKQHKKERKKETVMIRLRPRKKMFRGKKSAIFKQSIERSMNRLKDPF